MKSQYLALIAFLLLGLAACKPSPSAVATSVALTEEAKPIPDSFKTQVTTFIQAGAKLQALSSTGITYPELRQQTADVKAAYDVLKATWPTNLTSESQAEIEKALQGWDLTISLWDLKIGEKDNPVEPNINGYAAFLDYEGDKVVLDTYSDTSLVEAYRGKKFLPFDKNISVLLSLAGNSYETGKTKLLDALKNAP